MAMDFVAPPAGIGLPIGGGAAPAASVSRALDRQTVNRADKGDRLPVSVAGKQPAPVKPSEKLLAGCEPAYSPLARVARDDVRGRCVASISIGWKKQV